MAFATGDMYVFGKPETTNDSRKDEPTAIVVDETTNKAYELNGMTDKLRSHLVNVFGIIDFAKDEEERKIATAITNDMYRYCADSFSHKMSYTAYLIASTIGPTVISKNQIYAKPVICDNIIELDVVINGERSHRSTTNYYISFVPLSYEKMNIDAIRRDIADRLIKTEDGIINDVVEESKKLTNDLQQAMKKSDPNEIGVINTKIQELRDTIRRLISK